MLYTDETFKQKFGHGYYENTTLISNSMVSTFMKSPYRYKEMYIDKTITREPTDSMIVGGAVDCILTEGFAEFNKQYEVVKRRTDKARQINETMYKTVIKLVDRILEQPVYQDIVNGCKKYQPTEMQLILVDEELGVKGKLDFLQVSHDGKSARIIDLKTTKSIRPDRYHYSCIDYGYYRQMAMYRHLVLTNYPSVKNVVCYHLSIEKDNDGIYDCSLFHMGTDILDVQFENLREILSEIKAEKEFARSTIEWDDAVLIGSEYDY